MKIGKWKKKPVVVEAYQWFASSDEPSDVIKMDEPVIIGEMVFVGKIRTLEDTDTSCHYVCDGDFVVRGNHNDVWAVKEAIFLKTYSKVKERGRKPKVK